MKERDTKANVKAQFGKNASNYMTSKTHANGNDLRKLMEVANLKGNEYVLDIATGGGHVANALAPLVREVVALDLTNEILEVAKSFIESNGNSNVAFVQGDAEQLSFDDETFDIVTCRIAAHHFPDISAFVREAFRVVKAEGALLLIDNVAPERDDFDQFYNKIEKDRDHSHHRAWKKTEWYHKLEVTGFEIEESYRFQKLFQFDTWCKMMNLSDEKKTLLSNDMVQSTKEHQAKFRIQVKDGKVDSFMGESILIKATKPSL
ncbi:class I SAM-dependent methyltransferase [Halalkalibacter kiskunsagensis]|uniref:Class I SAM-dependent methyltransferase n=1 Tax=Halalkalibacter kiskunsagensis TaxID=1548599 RepID=A0ABV6KFF2_9BACI